MLLTGHLLLHSGAALATCLTEQAVAHILGDSPHTLLASQHTLLLGCSTGVKALSRQAPKQPHGHFPREGNVAQRVPDHRAKLDDEERHSENKALELRTRGGRLSASSAWSAGAAGQDTALTAPEQRHQSAGSSDTRPRARTYIAEIKVRAMAAR